jgi:uncharacterized protein (DUF302 family)
MLLLIDVNARRSGAPSIEPAITKERKCRSPIGSIAAAYRAAIARGYRLKSQTAFPLLEGGVHPPRNPKLPPTGGNAMSRHITLRLANFATSLLLLFLLSAATSVARADSDDGIVRVKSAVPMSEAIGRIKADIAAKGIKFFLEVDQSKLAADAGIKLRPSTLLVFGNPPLGTQFITANPNAGLDWPVRLLLTQDDNGEVWAVWTDFDWIAKRHNISNREAQFKMATMVVKSITSTITTK